MSIEKMNHYSLTNPASRYDEEALTALELAARTAAKMDETVEGFNKLEDVITAANKYMVENIASTTTSVLERMRENGSLNDIITTQTFKDISEGFAYIADREEGSDITEELKNLLETNGKVKVIGKYTVSGVELKDNNTVIIDGEITCTGEYGFWFNGPNIKLSGADGASSVIGNGENVPVIFGSDLSDNPYRNVVFCELSSLNICRGSTGIFLNNNETAENGIFAITYFNTIKNVRVKQCSHGIVLRGYTNANYFDNITFYECGSKENGAIEFQNIGSKVPIENSFSNIFHTNSTNATTIYFKCNAFFNSFTNTNSEPGGEEGSYCRVSEGCEPYNNTLQGSPNTRGGNQPKAFLERNTVIYPYCVATPVLIANEIQMTNTRKFIIDKSGLAEQTAVDLLNFQFLTNGNSMLVTFKYYTQNSVGASTLSTGGIESAVVYNLGGTFYLKGSDLLTVSADGTIKFTTPFNAGTTKGVNLYGVLEVMRKNVDVMVLTAQ